MPLLDCIDSPSSLKRLDLANLQVLAGELRAFILQSVAASGGHLASNLGTVELAVALHYVFDTPQDRLVWDVGHQSYAHKILTGRKGAMGTVRKVGGISGFPVRDESPYDAFGAGHAGTSVSAALGIALGLRCVGDPAHAIAVIGDGALTAGMAFEALNHAGTFSELPLVIVVNDNGMSISPPVGALHQHLQQRWAGRHVPLANETPGRTPTADMQHNGADRETLFELLGLDYTGPVDGHDLNALVAVFRDAKQSGRPRVIHVLTKKGLGYAPAEIDPVTYHGPASFDVAEGVRARARGKQTYSEVFSDWVCDAAARDERVVAITPAMREGSCLVEFERRFPERYVDVGIAEQHALTLAAGLAAGGARPVVAIYSTFLQRGYDQLIHDIALQNLPVLFALDRAGIAGGDGATHVGAFDIAALRCIPNLVIMTPSDEEECYRMLSTGFAHSGPSAVRYPRAVGLMDGYAKCSEPLPLGKGVIRRCSGGSAPARVALLAFGPLLAAAMAAGEVLDATVADMRFVKPLDEALLLRLAEDHDLLVTVEEATAIGGAGAACAERIAAQGLAIPVLRLGLPDAFVAHGDRAALLSLHGLDAQGIVESIRQFDAGAKHPVPLETPLEQA